MDGNNDSLFLFSLLFDPTNGCRNIEWFFFIAFAIVKLYITR